MEKSLRSCVGNLERVARVSVNFLWNLTKTFVSADFVVIHILSLLPAGENDLLAPENFKVLFRHDQLVMAY